MRLLVKTLVLVFRLPEKCGRFLITAIARLSIYVWEIFITSLFIQIGLALPMIFFFHRLSVSGLSANAVVVPVLSAVVPLGFIAIGLNSQTLASACAGLLRVSRWAVAWHARWEPDWRIPSPPVWLALLFTILLVGAALRVNKKWGRIVAWAGAAAALAVIVIHPFAPVVRRGNWN